MSELKPCPFCGNEPQEITLNGKPLVVCWGRGCVHDPKNWNTRPIEDALHARIAELEAAQRWIPVSERLPELDEMVFVLRKYGYGYGYLSTSREGETHWYLDFSADGKEVYYWMPIPKESEVEE